MVFNVGKAGGTYVLWVGTGEASRVVRVSFWVVFEKVVFNTERVLNINI